MKKKMENNQFQGKNGQSFSKTEGLGATAAHGVPDSIAAQSEPKPVKKGVSEMIDVFCHILPKKYNEALLKKAKPCYNLEANSFRPALTDLDIRFRALEKFEGLRQVLTIGSPPLESVTSSNNAAELAQMANDEMAELVNKYPDRFAAAVACLPLNDMDASLREVERAIKELKCKGIQIASSINGKPLDSPEFFGIYEKMAQYDLPIWIHPARDRNIPDYPNEGFSKYGLFVAFGWPYETTLAMARLVFGGIMEKYPNIKFIAHHCGAMIPFFSKRVLLLQAAQFEEITKISKPPLEYFKRFYGDTVLNGDTPALMCGYAFFGSDNLLFGSDYPYPGGPEKGDVALGNVIKSVELMDVTEKEKSKIFSKNASRLLKLD